MEVGRHACVASGTWFVLGTSFYQVGSRPEPRDRQSFQLDDGWPEREGKTFIDMKF